MSTRNKVCVLIFLVLLVFAILAKVDYAIHGYGGYYPPEEVVRYHWFWQWQVGIPLMSLAFAAAFWAGAPKTQRNLKMALGIFFTPVLLFVGQLEDYLFFTLNGIPFPEGEWTWFRDMWFYNLFGTWNTELHLLWLSAFILATFSLWIIITR